MADEKIIFSMCGVGKTLPHNNKTILKAIVRYRVIDEHKEYLWTLKI